MIVDTNILLDIYTQDEVLEDRSAAAIAAAADVTVLVINPIIYGELSVGIERIEALDQFKPEGSAGCDRPRLSLRCRSRSAV
jgi:predicted nucleic acid-binding protein